MEPEEACTAQGGPCGPSAGVGRTVKGRKCPGDPRGQNWDLWQKEAGRLA